MAPVKKDFISRFFLIIAIGLAVYTVKHHLDAHLLGSSDAACNLNSYINCDKTSLSQFSEVFSIPLGIYGIAVYLFLLCGIRRIDRKKTNFILSLNCIVSVGLIVISIFVIKSICIVCFALHFIHFLLFFLNCRIQKFSLKFERIRILDIVLAIFSFALPSVGYFSAKSLLSNYYENQVLGNTPQVEKSQAQIKIELILNRKHRATTLGNPHGTLNALVFVDFTCPYCEEFLHQLQDILKTAPELTVSVHHFPLDRECNLSLGETAHEGACKATALFECLISDGNFETVRQNIYNLDFYAKEYLTTISKDFKLNIPDVTACVTKTETLSDIKDDIRLARMFSVQSVPAMILEGRKITLPQLRALLRTQVQ